MPELDYGQSLALLTAFFREQTEKRGDIITLIKNRQQFLKWFTTDTNGAGRSWDVPLIHAHPRGIGPTRAAAQLAAKGGAGRSRAVNWKGDWSPLKASLFLEEKELLLEARGDEATKAFLKAHDDSRKNIMEELGARLEEAVWAGDGGAIAYGSIHATSGVVTLSNKVMAQSFKPGDPIEASANDGSSSGHSTFSAKGYVLKSDGNTGTVTVSATDGGSAGTPTGWTGSIYLFRAGQFGGGSDPEIPIVGINSWIPAAAPSGTFMNVDRTIDVVATSGVRLTSADVATLGKYDHLSIIKAMLLKHSVQGFKLSNERAVFVHPEVWEGLSQQYENNGMRSLVGTDAKTGLRTLSVITADGDVPIIAATGCPYNMAKLIDKKAGRFRSVGAWPVPAGQMFGQRAVVQGSEDYYEFRWMGYGQLQIVAPGACATAYLPGSPSIF